MKHQLFGGVHMIPSPIRLYDQSCLEGGFSNRRRQADNNLPPLSNMERSASNFIALMLSRCPSRTMLENSSWENSLGKIRRLDRLQHIQ